MSILGLFFRGLSIAGLAMVVSGCAGHPAPASTASTPAAPPALLDRFQEVVVADFTTVEAPPDLALGRKVADYLETELRASFKGKVSRRSLPAEAKGGTPDAGFWKSAGSGLAAAAFLTGTAGLREDAQKALKAGALPADGPFNIESHGIAERKRFDFAVEIALVDAATGETLWKREVRETKFYPGVQQFADFALVDLLPVLKRRVLPALVGQIPASDR